MSAGPRVSVVLPTYERREWVCRAVRSVFAQRYTDWELIVVDDGSTDGTEEALRQFGPRLRYLWQENRGVSSARNAGLRLGRGDIVAFLDSDDRWLPDHLETVVAMLERHPEAVLASTCPEYRISGREQVERARVEPALPEILFCNLVGYPSGVAVRRDAILAVGCFDERLEVGEDGDLFNRLALRGPFVLLQRRTIVRQSTLRLAEGPRWSARFVPRCLAAHGRACRGGCTARRVDAFRSRGAHALRRRRRGDPRG